METNQPFLISRICFNDTPRMKKRRLYQTIDNIFKNKQTKNISIQEQEKIINQKISEQMQIQKPFNRQLRNHCQFKRSLVENGKGMTVQSNLFYVEDNSHRQIHNTNKNSSREPIYSILKTQPSEDYQPKYYSISNQITRTKSRQLLKRLQMEKELSQFTKTRSMFPLLINSVLQ